MRIIILQDRLRGGGTEKNSVLLANGFQGIGHEVLLCTFRPRGIELSQLNTPHQVLQKFDTCLNFYAPGLAKCLAGFTPDIILCMGREANSRGVMIKRALPAVCLLTTVRTARRMTRRYKQSLCVADGVLVNSEWAGQRAVACGAERSRIHVLPNLLGSFPEPLEHTKKQELRQQMGVSTEQAIFINVAGFRKNKGQAQLLHLLHDFKHEREWKLWLIGDGKYFRRCVRLALRLGLQDRVCFWGHRKNVAQYLQAADVALLTSKTESQPNFLVEAQGMGLPVVSWDVAGERETFIDGKSGYLVKPDDAGAFYTALAELLDSPDKRAEMGTTAQVFARNKFDNDKVVLKYMNVVGEIALKY